MFAFAANSLLCRLALRQTTIDAASFTLIRIVSGALVLWAIAQWRRTESWQAGNWRSAFALFAYAAAFSFAYLGLSAGTGALLLFGAVQATMIVCGLHRGERLSARQLAGLAMALGGLAALLFPGLSAPPFVDSLLMLTAGLAWGIYSLRGQRVTDPAGATTGNFIRAVFFAGLLSVASFPWARMDMPGVCYAVVSGALASGVGYVIWYAALPGLKAASAATIQLSVPVLTAAGGILLLGEALTARSLFASLAILSGIALVVIRPFRNGRGIRPPAKC